MPGAGSLESPALRLRASFAHAAGRGSYSPPADFDDVVSVRVVGRAVQSKIHLRLRVTPDRLR
jgi:hypothetical protein